ncbi:h domain protein [Nocardia sp. NPDC059240]|uniref:h domain protein n=1 Tax=Nocardia sp. NPDC059240 TaxID=3346786 RepID=UPI0036A2D599
MKINARSIMIAVAGVLLVAAVAVGSLVADRFWSDRTAERNRASAADFARDTVEDLFTYNYDSAEKELPKVAERLSGAYRDSYMQVINEQAIPAAKEKKLDVQTVVQATGVIDSTRDTATVLVIADQRFSSTDSGKETLASDRLQVKLTKHDDSWLVSDIKTV